MLTTGNTAKLYCLERIATLARERGSLSILDLGCGDGSKFAPLLRDVPGISYVGVDPSPARCERARTALAGLNAEVRCEGTYGLDLGRFDVVASFSVLMYVRDRAAYLSTVARSLAPVGRAFVMHDAGHFFRGDPRARLKDAAGRGLAAAGWERWYRQPVREDELRLLFAGAGLEVVEARAFNSTLKEASASLPPGRREAFERAWLAAELALGDAGLEWDDRLLRWLRTRSYELRASERS